MHIQLNKIWVFIPIFGIYLCNFFFCFFITHIYGLFIFYFWGMRFFSWLSLSLMTNLCNILAYLLQFLNFRIDFFLFFDDFFLLISNNKKDFTWAIIPNFVEDIFYLPFTILPNKGQSFLFRNLNNLYLFAVGDNFSLNFKQSIHILDLNLHLMSVDHHRPIQLWILYFIFDLDWAQHWSASKFLWSKTCQIKLAIGHSFHSSLIILPVPVDLFKVQSWFFID